MTVADVALFNENTRLIYGAFYGQVVDGRNLSLPILGATFKSGAEKLGLRCAAVFFSKQKNYRAEVDL